MLQPSELAAMPLPMNLDAERQLLGNLLFCNDLIDRLSFLDGEHFSEPVNRRLFNVIRDFRVKGEKADPVTLKQHFDGDEALADIGGSSYLVSLVAGASTSIDVKDYGLSVCRDWQRRQVIDWCASAMREVGEPANVPDEVAAGLFAKLNGLAATEKRREVMTDAQIIDQIAEDMAKDETNFCATGLEKLDSCMGGGLYPGYTYGFGARKKVGKTVLAGTISYNLNQAGIKHLFIAGEMGAKQIHQRVLARHLNCYSSDFRGERARTPQFQERVVSAARQSNGCTLYQNAPGLTFDDLKRYMSAGVYQHKVEGVILDYWQLVGGKSPKDSDAKHLDNVAQWIADFCREHGIWSVVFAQINQEGNTRGGEGLRLACDQFYQIHREDTSAPDTWVEMMDTRYTQWMNIGNEEDAGWFMEPKGPYFREV